MYKKYIDNNSKTGRGRKEFEYAEEMHKILGKKNIAPTLVLASDTVENESFHTNQGPNLQDRENVQLEEEEISEKIVNTQENTRKGKAKIKNCNRKTMLDHLKGIREDRKEYYKRRLAQEDKRLEILQSLVKEVIYRFNSFETAGVYLICVEVSGQQFKDAMATDMRFLDTQYPLLIQLKGLHSFISANHELRK